MTNTTTYRGRDLVGLARRIQAGNSIDRRIDRLLRWAEDAERRGERKTARILRGSAIQTWRGLAL